MTPLRAIPLLAVLLSITAFLRPLSAHNGAVAIAVPVEGIGNQIAYRLLIATTDRIAANAIRAMRAQEKQTGHPDPKRAEVAWPSSIDDLRLSLPSAPEQTAIAKILSDMDTEIAGVEAKIAKTRWVKQGMMQELLTGRIRLV